MDRLSKKLRILFVVGSCLKTNSSANLCHMAYIRGAVDCGCEVDVLSVSDKDMPIDLGIVLPSKVNWFFYNSALYTRISYRKNKKRNIGISSGNRNNSDELKKETKISLGRLIKNKYISSQGIFGFDRPWIKKVSKYKNKSIYDIVISLAWPPASHEAARRLLDKKNIKARCWCQIWEDPWYLDLWMEKDDDKYQMEKRLISCADRVLYVSPITLEYQRRAFKEYKNKMFWEPLPFYYNNNQSVAIEKSEDIVFGYYGDYHPNIRNIIPFYEAAREKKVKVNIYGNPSGLISETDRITIRPRVDLETLHKVEQRTDVLVYLCNIKGGQIPGKLYQYSSTSKKILFILDGTPDEIKKIFNYYNKYKRYIFCQNNKMDIEKAIDKIVNNKVEDIKNEPIEDFNPKKIFTDIVNECLFVEVNNKKSI